MNNAIKYLEKHLAQGTSNQIQDVNLYLEGFEDESTLVGESTNNGNEMFIFKDGSTLVRIDDEAFAGDEED